MWQQEDNLYWSIEQTWIDLSFLIDMFLSLVAAISYPTSINLQYNLVNIICGLSMFYPKYLVTRVSKNCVNEEKVTVSGCLTGYKEFL